MRFDYLSDAPPDSIDYVRRVLGGGDVRALLSFLTVGVLVICCAWAIEQMHVNAASQQVDRARAQLDRGIAALVRVRAEIAALKRWTSLDRRVRAIKVSGAARAVRVAAIARLLPGRLWLTSLTSAAEDDLEGRTIGLEPVEAMLDAAPSMKLVGVRAEGDSDRRVLTFRAYRPGR
jgi:hypothetical protein